MTAPESAHAVTTQIAAGEVSAAAIAVNAVTRAKIDGDVITTSKLTAHEPAPWQLLATAANLCPVCQHYAGRRAHVVAVEVALVAAKHDVDPVELWQRYIGSVHARHLAGGCLSTRTRTPDEVTVDDDGRRSTRMHVTRSCNGCQTDLGDVRDDELEAAVAGGALPDVRLECGCHGRRQEAAA